MRGGTVQINWHDTKPVLTLDFHPISGTLATGGADFDIKIWQLQSTEPQKKVPSVSYLNSLSYHSCAVNALRFSNSGEFLASGADGGEMILWKLHTADGVETWKVHKTLTFHRKDILDLQWSKDGDFLISGSVDNSCIIWDALKGSVLQIINEHCHYVQGVAWDPLGKFVTSLSSDRTCRVYVKKPRHKTKGSENHSYVCQHIISKIEHQADEDSKALKHHLFHDETLPSFFRRLAWSPDGSFLLVPGGSYKFSPTSEPVNTAYVFSRKDFSRPALQLPGATKPVVAVRFCPLAFSLLGSKSANGLFKLPYRLIFAVATLNSLYIYDTENTNPIAILAGLHYAAITDVAWSPDAKYLALSSQDGYCTLVEFENQELGSPVPIAEKGVADIGGKNLDTTNVEPMEIDEVRSESYVTHQKSENDENNDKGGMAVPTTSTQKSENDGNNDKGGTPIRTANTQKSENDGNNDKGGTPIRTANTQKSENDGNKEKGGTPIRTANTQKSENDGNKEKGGTAIQNTNTQTSQIEENKEKGSAATPTTSKQPQPSNKQARRRITPMAIDP